MSSILAAGLCWIPLCAAAQVIGSPVAHGAPRSGSAPADPSSVLPSALEARALSFGVLVLGELFTARRLVPPDATRYRGNLNLHVELDTSAAGWWGGGQLFLDLQNGHGAGFALLEGGVSLELSDIDSSDFTQVYQWGLQQDLASGLLRLRLGKQDVNDVFAVNSLGAEFISPPFTLIPTIPMPTFPAPALGAALLVAPEKPLSLRLGVFDGGPRIGGLGFDTLLDGAGGTFWVMEPIVSTRFGHDHHLPGTWHLGLWYHSGNVPGPEPEYGGPRMPGDYGAYLLVDQMLSPRADEGRQRGTGVFVQLGWAPPDVGTVSRHVGLGLKIVGVLPGRGADVLGIGVATSRWNLSAPPGARRDIFHSELFYLVRLNSWASVQPDLQVFDSGAGRAAHVWAFGLRWIVQLR